MARQARPPRAGKTFSGRMALYFSLTAIMTALVLSAVLALTWEGQFQSYTRQNMQRLAQQAADNLAVKYSEAGGWTDEVLSYASYASDVSRDIGVQVMDVNGEVLYDDTSSTLHHDGFLAEVPGSSEALVRRMPERADSVVSASIVTADGASVGSVRLWAFGSEALITKSDAAFRTNSYGAIVGAAGAAVVIACFLSYFASRALTRPIMKITSTAAQIRNGDLTARTGLKGDDEIGRLGETFDSMATELERDIKFEHRLTSDVAHELRTPLMAMLATVEAMQDEVLPADDEHFEIVAAEVRHLSRLVDAMLHLSRIENGTTALKTERTDLVYLAKSLVSMQEQLFIEKGLRLRFDDKTADHELYADVDPDLVREALTNLMSNAMRYTPDGGWVVVVVERNKGKGEALIGVRDTGIGIAKEDIPRVFSRFWRSDASRERVSGGLGVGLSLTKEIIDKHNGAISVESELGKGTTFTLHLPLDHGKKGLVQALQEQ
uniref:sensor histidine kinase n=1 Tax=Olsenella urininfantis TaxID=1871033 RepID=UPI0009874D78